MGFRTKLDYSDNRQIKQRERSFTNLSGGTVFGVPFSALTTGVDPSNSAVTETYTTVVSTFSGNATTTNFTWYDPRMDIANSSISAITSSNSGITQNTGNVFVVSSTGTTPDGYNINLEYTGTSFDLAVNSMFSGAGPVYSGTVTHNEVDFLSAGTLDYKDRTIWIDNPEITRTNRLIVTNNPSVGYVLTCDSVEGEATWSPVSAATSGATFWEEDGTGNTALKDEKGGHIINGVSDYSIIAGGSVNSIESATNSGILGGINNVINDSSDRSTILGGLQNTITSGHTDSVIAGGSGNTIHFGAIGNGEAIIASNDSNIMSSNTSTIIGSVDSGITGNGRTNIFGSVDAQIYGNDTDVHSGNLIMGVFEGVISGATVARRNMIAASNTSNMIGDGSERVILGSGGANLTSGNLSGIISSFWSDIESSSTSVILGSRGSFLNKVILTGSSSSSIISSSESKIYDSDDSSILGGDTNFINNSNSSAIVGGQENTISGHTFAGIFAGSGNTIDAPLPKAKAEVILGGVDNTISGDTSSSYSSILGGERNLIDNGAGSSIVGGTDNIIVKGNRNFIAASIESTIDGTLNDSDFGAIIATSLATLKNNADKSAIIANLRGVIDGSTGSAILGGSSSGLNFNVISGNSSSSVIVGGRAQLIDGGADSSIIGGSGNTIDNVDRSVVLGGQAITATADDTVYMNNLTVTQPGGILYSDMDNSAGALFALSGSSKLVRHQISVGTGGAGTGAGGSIGIRAWDDATYTVYGQPGDMHIYAGITSNGLNIISADGGGASSGADYIRFYAGQDASGTADMHIQGTGITQGYVGIATESPTQRIDVDGNGRFRNIGSSASAGALHYDATGVLTTNTSDERMKDEIITIDSALEKIKQLRGVYYKWKEDIDRGVTDNTRIGFIAQEVEKIVPELTFRNERTEDKLMGVHYQDVTALLVEAIKELIDSGVTNISKEELIFETQTIASEDNNIELNYGGTHESSLDGGLTVVKGIDENNDATLMIDSFGDWTTNTHLKPNGLVIPEFTPTSSNDNNGKIGEVTRDDEYLYIKTKNGWRRTGLETF